MNRNNKYGGMIFLEPDDASFSGEGGAAASATADPWSHNGDDEGGGAEPQTQVKPEVVTPPPVATIDPKAFEAFGKSFGETFAKTQQAHAPQLPPTPEQMAEARRALKFFDIDDNFVKDFGNLETQKASLERFRDGITQHIITVMNHLRGNDRTEFTKMFDDRLTPVQSMIEERQNNERQQKFGTRFPQFADPKIASDVNYAIGELAGKKAFEGKSESESFKLVAEYLAGKAKHYNPAFVLEDAEASGANPTRSSNAIPVTSHGSGASRSGNPASSKKGWALAHMK